MLELHSDASAWWVLPRDDQYAAAELRDVARALDLDELAIKDLLADDHRVKYEEVGQARLVITSAVSVDAQQGKIIVHPVSIIATDRALICLSSDHPALQPAQLLSGEGRPAGPRRGRVGAAAGAGRGHRHLRAGRRLAGDAQRRAGRCCCSRSGR